MTDWFQVNHLESNVGQVKIKFFVQNNPVVIQETLEMYYHGYIIKLYGSYTDKQTEAAHYPLIYKDSQFINELQALENESYRLEIAHPGVQNLKVMSKLHNESPTSLRKEIYVNPNVTANFVNWRSYVGKEYLRVTWDTFSSWQIPIEVRASKVDYFADYKTMVEEITASISNIIWNEKSMTSLNAAKKNAKSKRSQLEDFFFIKAAMMPDRIPSYLQIIESSPVTDLLYERRVKSIGEVSNLDYRSLISIASNPDFLITHANTAIPTIPGLLNRLPTDVEEKFNRLTFDTPENQFVKYWMIEISNRLDEIEKFYDDDTFIGFDSKLINAEIRHLLAHPMFNEVSNVQYPETSSLSLRRRAGYAEMFELYEKFSEMSDLDLDDLVNLLFHRQIKPVYEIYELWVLFELIEILKSIATGTVQYSYGKGKAPITAVKIPFHSLMLELNYQTVIEPEISNKPLTSFSLRMDPDFRLTVFDGSKLLGGIVLDAKYKFKSVNEIMNRELLEEEGEGDNVSSIRKVKRIDLLMMHAYKDSIREVSGAYVLLPSQELNGTRWFEKQGEVLPSVGALPLYPFSLSTSVRDTQRNEIKAHLLEIIDVLKNRKARRRALIYKKKP
ncbi:restriction endonuclease-like protein [Paenibacillus glycanilyticus]|uniref:DUF2357 domain-containing protein n=1 Tax=Paenibacillus glycanilyticus TaxID=126569 RepID=UPI00203AAE6E|nr:DUF2357 domain-containing protein [Paenibacillus glycanilyticus]MCM3631143.1 restriction endonuclease-like protein [Paenibacillus glycanilyticus]